MQSSPHIVATSSMSERIGPRVGAVVRLRRGHEGAVVRLDRLVRDDAGEDQLAASAGAPVVRLRLADRDLEVTLRNLLVQPDRCAARRDTPTYVYTSAFLWVVLEERDAQALHAREVVLADLLLGVGLRHREDLAVRADDDGVVDSSGLERVEDRREELDCGVGRNWLSITIATLVADARSSLKRGPECGCSSAARAASVASARVRLVRVDLGEQVGLGNLDLERVPVDLARRHPPRRSSADRSTRTE